MNGYFNGLMRMTGISPDRSDPGRSPVNTGIETPPPLHVEETHVLEAPAPAPPGIPPSNQAPGSAPFIPDKVEVKDQPGTLPGKDGTASAASRETGPDSPGTFPLESAHLRTVTGNRSAETNTSPPGSVPPIEESKNHSRQPDNGNGQVTVVEEEKEIIYPARPGAVEPHPGKTGKPGQSGTGHVTDTIVEIVPADKGKKEKIVTGKAAAAAPQTGGELAVEDVWRWVAEVPLKVDATVKERDQSPPPKTLFSQAAPLQDNREFNLSIGTISITVEEPQIRADVMNTPPTPPPPDKGQDRNASLETASSRLGRHYLRMRG